MVGKYVVQRAHVVLVNNIHGKQVSITAAKVVFLVISSLRRFWYLALLGHWAYEITAAKPNHLAEQCDRKCSDKHVFMNADESLSAHKTV